MENVVTLYHGGSVKLDRFSNVDFIGMEMVPLIFDSRPTFNELTARVRDELEWNSHEEAVPIEGVLQYGKMGQVYYRRLLKIASEVQWEKFVKAVKNNEIPGLDVVVRKMRTDQRPHVCSPPRNWSSPCREISPAQDIPAPNDPPPIVDHATHMQDTVVVPDAESAPNGIDKGPQDVVTAPMEIPLSQNHSSKCRSSMFHYFPHC